jgi:hypothetical protein
MGMARKKSNYKINNFVAIRKELLLSKAYIKLPPTARAMLPYFLWKVKIPFSDPSYYYAEFPFTFSEAEKYGCSKRTFSRVIEVLMRNGFIDPIRKGGRNGGRDTASIFRLSRRWEKYGNADFEPVSWKQFGADQIRIQVEKCHSPIAKSKPQEGMEATSQCQK